MNCAMRGVLAALLAVLSMPAAASATAAPAATSAAAAPLFPQQQADTTDQRLLQRLRQLGRTPADTVDTAAAAQPGQPMAGGRPERPRREEEDAGDDQILRALLELPGYRLMSYEGAAATYDAETNILTLYGNREDSVRAELWTPDGDQLRADSLIAFNQRTGLGRVLSSTFVPQRGDSVVSDSLLFDTGGELGSAFQARTQYSQDGGTTWYVVGDLPMVASETVYGSHARFTSCELEVPHYHFEGDEFKIIRGRILVARSVRLYFADVQVAWLPFIAQSLATGRSSGILTPRFSVNDIVRTNTGYQRRISNVGFYWAMSDYTDATVALDWFSDNFTSVTTALRYRWLRQFLDGSLNLRQYWRDEGSDELALETQNRWQIDERTNFNMSARYVSSTDFVRENSFDPLEVTRDIRSQGGINRRFDWGSLTASANRRQSLSDDRVDMTLPQVGLSLRPITLFQAPRIRARWYNNLTWSGSGSFSRATIDRPPDPDGFRFGSADQADVRGSARSSFRLGEFSLSQSLSLQSGTVRQVPSEEVIFYASPLAGPVDLNESRLSWNMTLDYQQSLVGSTTFTPRLRWSGEARRADTVEVAQDFVAGPSRMSFGAELKTDAYGFYPGLPGFEALRHKVSTAITYDWSPEVSPTTLQERVFGARTSQPRQIMSLDLNQTWEGKRNPPEPEAPSEEEAEAAEEDEETVPLAEEGEVVNLISLRTSAVSYDFVEADRLGDPLLGFQTTELRNSISSDFLRGLRISTKHDLFRDEEVEEDAEGGEEGAVDRRFDPHLTSMNFGFRLTGSSGIVHWLAGLFPERAPGGEVDEADEPGSDRRGATDETSIVPSEEGDPDEEEEEEDEAGPIGGDWRMNVSYSLTRPRVTTDDRGISQMVRLGLELDPSRNWEMSWDTSYDLERREFNDHRIRLTRDLHRWQAHFDFLQTATGNWTFRFEVSLRDNRDLKFDYRQRSLRPR